MFEKYTFPISTVYNCRVKEGGVSCGGNAENEVIAKRTSEIINKGVHEWHANVKSKQLVEISD